MRTRKFLLAAAIAASTAIAALDTAAAESMDMMPGGMDQQPTDRGMMQGGLGDGMMCPMMRSVMMQGGMTMGPGMRGGRGPGMMGSGMMRSGMGALFGWRVTPVMNLSVDDVRGYLALQLERLNNKRLKVGDVNSGDATITADIVTVDNSLVQRLKVDRHTGAIEYEN